MSYTQKKKSTPHNKKILLWLFSLVLSALILFSVKNLFFPKRWIILSVEEKIILHRIQVHWETLVPQKKKEGVAPLMTFGELYTGLGPSEQKFLDRVRAINPKKDFGFRGNYLGGPSSKDILFKRINNEWIRKNGKPEKLDPQYLPENVYKAYEAMMKAMQSDLGKRLLVESGYRSPAYQLYTFLFYLPKHHYSLKETGQWVALPGYSEHGAPHRQAIDFINQEGINGEDNPEDFERLEEYSWLLRRATEFGFELSYPRGGKGVTFEPWNWRYVGRSESE